MIGKKTSIALLAVCLTACAGSGVSSRSSAGVSHCPTGSIKVCTSLFEPSKERFPSCACSEMISSR
jgi:hypothetical protein